jgi:putative oxygen-independent coproporphyrinogen III oxidase
MPMHNSLAVYIHWPFCARKCPYCDYNSHVRAAVDQDAWRAALCAEIRHYAGLLSPQRHIHSIFFGGGTPSLMPPATVAAVLATLAQLWPFETNCEITLEANPTHLETHHFPALRAAGVNRLSLGVQALADADLRFLGREHSAAQAEAAIAATARHFDRWSFDLIWGRPGQTVQGWEAELQHALGFGAQHLSLYQLSIEDNTAFARRWQQGEFVLPDEDLLADLDDLTERAAAARGLRRYEISSFAVPGQECRHNLGYWRYQDYLGIGPGAHGRITLPRGQKIATETHKTPERWLRQVESDGHGRSAWQALSRAEQTEELLLLGLRLRDGIAAERWHAVSGQRLADLAATDVVRSLIAEGLLEPVTDSLRPTAQGRLLLNRIEAQLLGRVDN